MSSGVYSFVTGMWWPLKDLPSSTLDGVLFLSLFCLFTLFLQQKLSSRKFPGKMVPGPWGVPVLGYLPFLNPKKPFETFGELRKKYGDIFQVTMGSRQVVVLNGRKVLREALVRHSEAFAGRPDFETPKLLANGQTLAFNDYTPRWRLMHKLGSQAITAVLRHPHNVLQTASTRATIKLAEGMVYHHAKPFDPKSLVKEATFDVMFKFCLGTDADIKKDAICATLLNTYVEIQKNLKNVQSLDIMPWTQIFHKKQMQDTKELASKVTQLLREKLAEVQTDIEEAGSSSVLLALQALGEKATDDLQDVGLSKDSLLTIIEDFIGAGISTISSLTLWNLLYMAHFPDVQQRMQEEIDQALGVGGRGCRSPTEEDRARLPFTEAVVLEVARHSSVMPLSIPHATTQNVHIQGCFIPKGTMVFANLNSAGHDPSVWTNPSEFSPERFLGPDGQVDRQVSEQVPLFSYGKRRCIGERIARLQMLLFTVGIFRQVTVLPPGDQPLVGLDGGTMDIALEPPAFSIMVQDRQGRKSKSG